MVCRYDGTSEAYIEVALRGASLISSRAADWMRQLTPSRRYQVATALYEDASTWGSNANRPTSEIVCAPPKLPPAGRAETWIRVVVPSLRYQAASALPRGSTSTC